MKPFSLVTLFLNWLKRKLFRDEQKVDKFTAKGFIMENEYEIEVDSRLAQLMVEAPDNEVVRDFFALHKSLKINTENLMKMSQDYSVDVATLFYINKIFSKPENKEIQLYFQEILKTSDFSKMKLIKNLQNYHVVFIPAFGYNFKNNGGNFTKQRKLLDSLGFSNEMIYFNEFGLVEENANFIYEQLKLISKKHDNIIIVSISKGGLDFLYSLDKMAKSQEDLNVKVWLSVGGITKGTPVADYWNQPLRRTFMTCGAFFLWKRINVSRMLCDLSYIHRSQRYNHISINEKIKIYHYISVPMGLVEQNKRVPFPNDGFSPLADISTPGSVEFLEIGANHFLKNIDLNSRFLAILSYIVNNN